MAHVRAAQELLPAWLERGSGRFVSTVSAAGLLTMIGAAPYSVTKHGAYAFAEWLSLTYRHRGLKVHAICPQGVRTDMLDATGSAGDLVLQPTAIEPEAVADALFAGIAEDRFLILPHPEVAGYYQVRATRPDHWLANMNHIQQKWEATR
jgi:NAD(P)-dependent dehydrogenase (short-subunit alcohol dehydrogenase family)